MEDYGIVFIVWLNLPQKLLAMSFQRLRRPEFFRCGQGSRLPIEDTLEGGSHGARDLLQFVGRASHQIVLCLQNPTSPDTFPRGPT